MKTIEKYIQFAIDNGYNFTDGKYYIHHNYREEERDGNDNPCTDIYYDWYFIFHSCADIWCDIVSLEKIITSMPFIRAISLGIYKWDRVDILMKQVDIITNNQSIAIRDWKLEEFINEILK